MNTITRQHKISQGIKRKRPQLRSRIRYRSIIDNRTLHKYQTDHLSNSLRAWSLTSTIEYDSMLGTRDAVQPRRCRWLPRQVYSFKQYNHLFTLVSIRSSIQDHPAPSFAGKTLLLILKSLIIYIQGDWTPPVTPALWGRLQDDYGNKNYCDDKNQQHQGYQPQQSYQPPQQPPQHYQQHDGKLQKVTSIQMHVYIWSRQ